MSEESSIQKAIFKWYCVQYPKYRRSFQSSLNGIHIGGSNAARTINNLKAQGMCIGQSDIFIAIPRHGFHGKYIELKTLKGKPTKSQLEFGDDMVDQGYAFEIVKGFDACRSAISSYMSESL